MENNHLDNKDKIDIDIEIEEEVDYQEYNDIENNILKENDDEKMADKLCVIASILLFLPAILGDMYDTMYDTHYEAYKNGGIMYGILTLLNLGIRLCTPAAIILIVYIRAKYPQNKFGKGLTYFLGFLAVFSILFIVLVLCACNSCMNDCFSCFR